MKRRALLHVGSPKTGTTFLQAVLWRNRSELIRNRLLLPESSLLKHFRAALDVGGTPQRAAEPDAVEGAWLRLVEASADFEGDVLISHELFAQAPRDRVEAALAAFEGQQREVHVVLTARDLGRQLPAEWQERIKHRAAISYDKFIEHAQTPGTALYQKLWAAQDYLDIVERWGATLPASQVHVVTVPPRGAPKGLLWERFCQVLGIDPAAYDLEVPSDNSSLGLAQVELLRQVNQRLGDRLPLPGPYTAIGKGLMAHTVLAARKGTGLALGGADLDFARERSAAIVDGLRERGVDVVGSLDELLVPEGGPELSTPRATVSTEELLEESLGTTADLLAAFADRQSAWEEQRARLRQERAALRAELGRLRAQAKQDQQRTPGAAAALGVRVGRRAKRTARAAVERLRPRRPKIWLLMNNANGSGGVARTTINLANALSATHEVEIISVFTGASNTVFEVAEGVQVTYLVPVKPRQTTYPERLAELAAVPSVIPGADRYNALTDRRLRAHLDRMAAGDVLITTRPTLHAAATLLGPDRPITTIGWDHLNYPTRFSPGSWVGAVLDQAVPRLDGYVVLTEADAADYRKRFPDTPITVIRNARSWEPDAAVGNHAEKVVVAAGRLTQVKGFDRLVEAWRAVQDDFPDWSCRVYGEGELRKDLTTQAAALGATVEFPGYSDDIRGVFGRASLLAMTSRIEGFPMTLLEAATEGLPMVSFDCPRGPAEIITPGNGRLVPDGDVPAFASALRELMGDAALRERLGAQARQDSEQYSIDAIADTWRDLITQLSKARRG